MSSRLLTTKIFLKLGVDFLRLISIMKNVMSKARVNPEGYMGSASREHKVKKGKGSFTRKRKHKKGWDV